jgi:hypothetical protein
MGGCLWPEARAVHEQNGRLYIGPISQDARIEDVTGRKRNSRSAGAASRFPQADSCQCRCGMEVTKQLNSKASPEMAVPEQRGSNHGSPNAAAQVNEVPMW